MTVNLTLYDEAVFCEKEPVGVVFIPTKLGTSPMADLRADNSLTVLVDRTNGVGAYQ
jgi:hypothetical protein